MVVRRGWVGITVDGTGDRALGEFENRRDSQADFVMAVATEAQKVVDALKYALVGPPEEQEAAPKPSAVDPDAWAHSL